MLDLFKRLLRILSGISNQGCIFS